MSITKTKLKEILRGYIFIDPPSGDECILIDKREEDLDGDGWREFRIELFVTIDTFYELFGDILADATIEKKLDAIKERSMANKMGYERWVDKLKAEGIDF